MHNGQTVGGVEIPCKESGGHFDKWEKVEKKKLPLEMDIARRRWRWEEMEEDGKWVVVERMNNFDCRRWTAASIFACSDQIPQLFFRYFMSQTAFETG